MSTQKSKSTQCLQASCMVSRRIQSSQSQGKSLCDIVRAEFRIGLQAHYLNLSDRVHVNTATELEQMTHNQLSLIVK